MDVIDSGPERPVGRADRWLLRVARRLSGLRSGVGPRQRRTATVLVAVLAAVGVMAGLRSGLPAADRPASRQQLWLGPAGPPYDQLPGRTQIAPPRLVSEDGQRVTGILPTSGGPSETAARDAVDLVIGRYCRTPSEHSVQLVRQRGMVGRYGGYYPGGGYRGPRPLPLPTTAPTGPTAPAPGPSSPSTPQPTPTIEPWAFVVAVVTTTTSGHFDAVLTLYWVGSSYWWSGNLAQLNSCR
jgi:hypothetical protein